MAGELIDGVLTLITPIGGGGPGSSLRPLISLGIAAGGHVSWGECLLPAQIVPVLERTNFAERLRAGASAALVGQSLTEFRPVARLLADSRDAMLATSGIRAGIEQALLGAVARATGAGPVAVLRREYGLSGSPARPRLIAEIAQEGGTFELFSLALSHRPDGIGYRLGTDDLVSTVGQDAADLQRFLRELTDYAGDAVAPTVYLALNGALGELAGDPRRQLGRVVDLTLALERAAGSKLLLLEDPLIADDGTIQVALTLQLLERLRDAGSKVRVIVAAGMTDSAAVSLACEARAADGIVIRPADWGSIEAVMVAAQKSAQRGIALMIAPGAGLTGTGLHHAADIALAAGAESLLLPVHDGNADTINDIVLALAREIAAA